MVVFGFDSVTSLLQQESFEFKILLNDVGLVLFPHTTEHRDATQAGIKYADDSAGNALAGMVKPGRIEFRSHRRFTDERGRLLVLRMSALPELSFARSYAVSYQARILIHGMQNE